MHHKTRAGVKGSPSVSAKQAEVVETFLASGWPIAEVARQYGMNEQTVRDWIRQASDEAAYAPSTGREQPRRRSQAAPDLASGPENVDTEIEYALAEALAAVARAETAETEARAVAAEAVAKAAKAAKALARAQKKAAEAVARAGAAADSEAAIRAEITAVYAAAVEAMVRAEVAADEAVARAEASAAEAVARAEAAARAEITAAYAAAVEAAVRAEASAAERIAEAEAAAAHAVAQAGAAEAHHGGHAGAAPAFTSIDAQAERAPQRDVDAGDPVLAEEAAARAEIAVLVSRLKPVELWVQGFGRTLAEARQTALDQLDVDESEAEFEVLDKGSRWLPGRVRIRARIRATENSLSS